MEVLITNQDMMTRSTYQDLTNSGQKIEIKQVIQIDESLLPHHLKGNNEIIFILIDDWYTHGLNKPNWVIQNS